jgi:tetratricopeptide (TPR) repeat protein
MSSSFRRHSRGGRFAVALSLGTGLVLAAAPRTAAHGTLELRLERATHELERAPESPELLLRRAHLQRRSGDFASARADLDRAAQLAPELREVDYQRSLLLLDAGEPRQALAALDRLLAAAPDHVAGQTVRARSLRALGRPIESAAAYTSAISRW